MRRFYPTMRLPSWMRFSERTGRPPVPAMSRPSSVMDSRSASAAGNSLARLKMPRQKSHHRVEHAEDRNEQNKELAEQRCHPEWKIIVKERQIGELLAIGPREAAEKLKAGEIDVAFMMNSWDAPVVQQLLADERVALS